MLRRLKRPEASADSVAHMAVIFDRPADPTESGDGGPTVEGGRFRLFLALALTFMLPTLFVIAGTVFVVLRVIKLVASFWQ